MGLGCLTRKGLLSITRNHLFYIQAQTKKLCLSSRVHGSDVIVNFRRNLAGINILASETTAVNTEDYRKSIEGFNVGREIEGFHVHQVDEIPELNMTAVRLKHSGTGADYLHVARDDSNNVFCIGFRTTPMDSTGVPHILEHTTLCGSEKYPCRDPFFKMLHRSLSTFMNAMTGSDYTVYPFSTQNAKDFENLMSVYLDAVFHPQLRELDFMQEGWRLEHKDPQNPESSIIMKGVVFNEMKGAFSDSQQLFGQYLLNHLLPSHTYQFVSGGEPLQIPNLTWQHLKNFHASHYHPSNSRFFTYGNLPLQQHLRFINENYLKHFNQISVRTAVPNEVRWTETQRRHIDCRPDPMSPNPNKQTTVAVSYLLCDITDTYELFVLQILSEYLISGPNAPFYKSLLEPDIGSGLSPVSGFDNHTKDTSFTIGLQGIGINDTDKVITIIEETFIKVFHEGFDMERIESLLHSVELNLKHQTSRFGLGLIMGLIPFWNHDGDLVEALQINNKLEWFKKCLHENKNFLQEKVEKYFINNKHKLILSMSPNDNFEREQQVMEDALLKIKLEELSERQKEEVLQKGKALLEKQSQTEDLSCLPTLRVTDINPTLEHTVVENTSLLGIPLQICQQPTNGVTYFRAVLNTKALSPKLKVYLPLFCSVLTKMGAGNLDYRKLDQQIELKTGGLEVTTHIAESCTDLNSYEEGILISSHCLDRNISDMFALWQEIFTGVCFEDQNRLSTLVKMTATDLANDIAYMGHHYAMTSAASTLSSAAASREACGGMEYVKQMKKMAEEKDITPILNMLQTIAQAVLNKKHLRCAINTTPDNVIVGSNEIQHFLTQLPGDPEEPLLKTINSCYKPSHQKHQYLLPVPVNFTSKCVPTVPFTNPDYATLRTLARLLTAKFLHREVREKGGAYGGGAKASVGIFSFYSYRDPRSLETLNTYDSSIDWVLKEDFSDQDIEEAKLGVFQLVDAPVPPGSKGSRLFLSGISDEMFQEHREQLFMVNRSDLISVASKYLKNAKLYGATVIGPENEAISSSGSWSVNVE